MRSGLSVLTLVCAFGSVLAVDPSIRGDYLEVRTSDVYTGPCFANAEMNLTGKEAIMAWRVRSGLWSGVDLHDLSVVAVIRASATLGDPHADPQPTRAVVVVDDRASAEQAEALVDMARSMSGRLLSDVVWVRQDRIEFELDDLSGHPSHAEHAGPSGHARLKAGEIAEFETRSLNHGDHFCGNETVYYPPLADVQAAPAYTLTHRFQGDGLDSTWSSPFKRSAFIGEFTR